MDRQKAYMILAESMIPHFVASSAGFFGNGLSGGRTKERNSREHSTNSLTRAQPIDLMIRYVETGTFEAIITHNRYTLINRTAEPLLNRAAELSVPLLNAAPYGSGILAKGPNVYARYAYQDAPQELIETVHAMSEVCAEYDISLATAALQFSMRDPRVVSTVVGLSRSERVQQTIDLVTYPVPDELRHRLEVLIPKEQRDPEESRW